MGIRNADYRSLSVDQYNYISKL